MKGSLSFSDMLSSNNRSQNKLIRKMSRTKVGIVLLGSIIGKLEKWHSMNYYDFGGKLLQLR